MSKAELVVDLSTVRMHDVPRVGGKNASLGEMISQLAGTGVRVPGGFATTADGYREFLAQGGLDRRVAERLRKVDTGDVAGLAQAGQEIRGWIMAQELPRRLLAEVAEAYRKLADGAGDGASFAVRSSATAEDLADASFAGQQETFLNVRGMDQVCAALKRVYASLYTDRAISYRAHKGYVHAEVALSAGVQRMVRSDLGASGVMFTLDTESGFDQVVFITAAYGLGEALVQGKVNPDEFYVYKRALREGRHAILRRGLGSKAVKMVYADARQGGESIRTVEVPERERRRFSIGDAEVEELARYALIIEEHYRRPMDIEWGRDGVDGKLYILQARPETVKSRGSANTLRRYKLKGKGERLVSGRAIGQKIGAGAVRVLRGIDEMHRVRDGDVLVTDMTDPDWEPVMKRAAAIVTNRGGRTCHAAIIARELGIPAVVGRGDATQVLKDGRPVTVSCAEGDTGFVYRGILETEVLDLSLTGMPKPPVKITMNVGNPELAFEFQRLPNEGVGLARLEFIIARMIGVHPKAVLELERQSSDLRNQIRKAAAGYADPVTIYVDKLAAGVATLGAAFAPEPVIVRTSDFKSNEYANLIGGEQYEPREENPMLGFRGASRYYDARYREGFLLECQAMKQVREEMGYA